MSGQLGRALVLALLRQTKHGTLTIADGARRYSFGTATPAGPAVELEVHNRRFYCALLRGSLGLSEAYSEGWFECADLPELARLAGRHDQLAGVNVGHSVGREIPRPDGETRQPHA